MDAGVTLVERDQKCIWHPFTQEKTAPSPLPVTSARGAKLFLEDGRELLDLASSWWVNVHGHSHPVIARAIAHQAETLEHVIFAGVTHEPAVRLAEELLELLPRPLSRVFYADNGSTAVEIALKMAWQYWRNKGETHRDLFLAFRGGYHGDTFGAMSVGRTSGYYAPFEDLMCQVRHLPYAATWNGDADVETREAETLSEIDHMLDRYADRAACFIAEPLVQGAGGMNICRPEFLRAVCQKMEERGILVVLDEVMTGFGRTGTMFAMEQAGIAPDLACLSKGLTGGFMPMACTVASERIYDAFLGEDFRTALAHGHSFTANPLGCAAGLASLGLFKTEKTLECIAAINAANRRWLVELAQIPGVSRPRQIGSIAAVTIGEGQGDYTAAVGARVSDVCLRRGLLVRPMGNVVYIIPPACITPEELSRGHAGIAEALREATQK